MKRFLLVLLILAVIGGAAFGFDFLSYPPSVGGNAVMLDMGVGINWAVVWSGIFNLVGLDNWGTMKIPPIFFDAAYALPNIPLSVGLSVSYFQFNFSGTGYGYNYGWNNNFLNVGAKADWHWGFDTKVIDFYTGLTLGYMIWWYSAWWGPAYASTASTPRDLSDFDYGLHVGAHFYFTKIFGVMVEVGYPYLIKGGLSFKFGGDSKASSGSKSSKSPRYIVNTDTLNVREGPGTTYKVVGALKRNDRVEVLSKSGSWWKIKSGKIEGYVNSSYLKAE